MKKLTFLWVRDVSLRAIALVLAASDFIMLYACLFVRDTPNVIIHPLATANWPCLFGTIIGIMMMLFSTIASLLFLNSFLRNRRWWASLIVIIVSVAIPFDWPLFGYWFTSKSPTPSINTNEKFRDIIL